MGTLNNEELNYSALALLREIAHFSHRVDGRLAPEYEKGWNDAVDAVVGKARQWLETQEIDADTELGEG